MRLVTLVTDRRSCDGLGCSILINPPSIMTKNMSTMDRVIRTAAALLVVVLYFTNQISGFAAIILGIVAVIFAFTSSVSFCPLYAALGLSTRRKAEA